MTPGEKALTSRRFIVLCVLLAALAYGWFRWRDQSSPGQSAEIAGATIDKQPVAFAQRTFDPANPPADMPPLGPGEEAECDSHFLSNASVAGQTQHRDATHAIVTITQIKLTLQLDTTIWTPRNASSHVIEHEDGHRQISEYYYQFADQVAERIAAPYIGKQFEISGSGFAAESSKALQQVAAEITDEYGKQLSPEPTQQLYDRITDHGRNDVFAKDGVAAALKNVGIG